MKKIAVLIGVGLLNFSFGLDEYLSIEKGKTEVSAGYWYEGVTGVYDVDGKKQDLIGNTSPMVNLFPLQVKYGIIPGLDAELAMEGVKSNKDDGSLGGFSQPELAVKYTEAKLGVGGFLNLILPFETGNLDKTQDPEFGIAFGAVYQNRFGNFRLTGTAGYQINFEGSDKYQIGNILYLYAKPEAMWTEYIGTYLGLQYMMHGDDSFDGHAGTNTDGYLFNVIPGANVQLTKTIAYEVNAPISLMGKNAPASWSVGAKVFLTLPLQ